MDEYIAVLSDVERVAHAAADNLLALYDPGNRPENRSELFAAMRRNENAVSGIRGDLELIRPRARWLPDELESTPLPSGEWWVVDAVEGNVNHVHGTGEWCVTITLVADGRPVLTVVRQPIGDNTFTATVGRGARLGSEVLHVSNKKDLADAIALTGQAEHGQTGTHSAIGRSISAMLGHSLLVRATVPSTFPILAVASGHADVFWQYQPVLPGVAAGILLVTEAGGSATHIDGTAWTPGGGDILITNASLTAPATDILSSTIDR